VQQRDNAVREANAPLQSSAPSAGASSSAFATVLGPVVDLNFPDPSIIHIDGVSYAFATNNRAVGGPMIHVQMATSTDNETWTYLNGQDALPRVGAWATGARTWAPDVVQLDDGSFVMYYADEVTSNPAHHCVGVATSKTVMGPYAPVDTPFACPLDQGGAIDADGFQDQDGKRYVTYKVDGNSIGHGGECMNMVAPIVPTPIMLQEVGPDGITPIGAPLTILDRDALDGPLIEAPSLHRSKEGIYFLFFSSNCFSGPLYDTAYATATSISGPYTKAATPLFVTGDGPDMVGPGGADIVKDGSRIVLHGHLTDATGSVNYTPRGMYTAELTFSGHSVSAQ